MSTKELIEVRIPEKVQRNAELRQSINALVAFDISGEGGGQWTLDLTQDAVPVQAGLAEAAKVTVQMAVADFEALLGGALNAQMAFLSGKLKVHGDMALALKLGKLLS